MVGIPKMEEIRKKGKKNRFEGGEVQFQNVLMLKIHDRSESCLEVLSGTLELRPEVRVRSGRKRAMEGLKD